MCVESAALGDPGSSFMAQGNSLAGMTGSLRVVAGMTSFDKLRMTGSRRVYSLFEA